MQIETIKQAKKYMKVVDMVPKKNVVYNFYQCGCVFEAEKARRTITYKGKTIKSCLIHRGQKFLTKYKACVCGEEYLGTRLKPGACGTCSYKRWADKPKEGKAPKEKAEITERNRLASRKCFDCGFRGKCLTDILEKFPLAKTLLCFGCLKYYPVSIVDSLQLMQRRA
jgi:hypothetical protein